MRKSDLTGRVIVDKGSLPPLAKAQLKAAIEQSGSFTKAAEVLRKYPGFSNIDRTTIHKWTTTHLLPERAYIALRLLQKDKGLVTLRFAIPNVLWMLPPIMMTWNASGNWSEKQVRPSAGNGQKRFRPYGLLSDNGVTNSVITTATGEEALDWLESGEVDVAFAAEDLVRRLKPSSKCFPLCSFGEAPIEGVSTIRISAAHHLSNCVIGYNPSTAVGEKVKDLADGWGVMVKFLALTSVDEFVAAFRKKKISVAIGWEPLIGNIKAQLGGIVSSVDFENIRPRPTVRLMTAVNVVSADPLAVRAFLRILDRTLSFFQDKQDKQLSEDFYREIERGFKSHSAFKINMDRPSLEKTLKTEYRLGSLEPEPVLKLWEHETNRIK